MSIDAEDGTITRLLNRSTEFEATLQFEFPEEQLSLPTMEQRHKIAANAALLAIEHASALRASAQVKAMNSAAGLLRLQYEAVLRAAWLLYSASPGQVKKLTSSLDLDAEQKDWLPRWSSSIGTHDMPSIRSCMQASTHSIGLNLAFRQH